MLSKMRKHVLWGCMLVLAMLAARIIYTGKSTYLFLLWNMFLAFVPWMVAYVSNRFSFRSVMLIGSSMIWLLFFPNAPYLITDLYHLSHLAGVPIWYDALMLFTAAYTCVVMGFISLRLMEIQWNVYWYHSRLSLWIKFKPAVRWLLIAILFTATGFGIYLGRVLRYNSWDIITDTQGLVFDIGVRVLRPVHHFQTWGFTLVYAACLLFFYHAWMGSHTSKINPDKTNES